MTKGNIALIITIIVAFVIGIWPLGLVLLGVLVYQNSKKSEKGKTEETQKSNICEFEIYKQAAEIEKHLKEDKP